MQPAENNCNGKPVSRNKNDKNFSLDAKLYKDGKIV